MAKRSAFRSSEEIIRKLEDAVSQGIGPDFVFHEDKLRGIEPQDWSLSDWPLRITVGDLAELERTGILEQVEIPFPGRGTGFIFRPRETT